MQRTIGPASSWWSGLQLRGTPGMRLKALRSLGNGIRRFSLDRVSEAETG
jgi:hypothetical protein